MAWTILRLLSLLTWAGVKGVPWQDNIYIYPPRYQETLETCFMQTKESTSCKIYPDERLQRIEGSKVRVLILFNIVNKNWSNASHLIARIYCCVSLCH